MKPRGVSEARVRKAGANLVPAFGAPACRNGKQRHRQVRDGTIAKPARPRQPPPSPRAHGVHGARQRVPSWWRPRWPRRRCQPASRTTRAACGVRRAACGVRHAACACGCAGVCRRVQACAGVCGRPALSNLIDAQPRGLDAVCLRKHHAAHNAVCRRVSSAEGGRARDGHGNRSRGRSRNSSIRNVE